MSPRSGDRGGRRRTLAAAALTAAATFVSGGGGIGSTSATFTAQASASEAVSTRAACASGSPYAALLSAPAFSPTLWWRFANLTGTTTVLDSSGHGNTGTVLNAGLTFGVANTGLVSCDTTYALRQPGTAAATGFVVQPTARTSPSSFTIATWVLSASLTGGRLVGFGDAAAGGSTLQDRALLFDRSGRAVFHLRTSAGNLLLTSPARVTTNTLHLVVATMSGSTAVLYVDGAPVASAPVPALAAPYTGYWRAGWDQNVATLIPSARNQANVRQDEVAIWEGRALGAPEVASLWAANHW
jgi:hypothetical protein